MSCARSSATSAGRARDVVVAQRRRRALRRRAAATRSRAGRARPARRSTPARRAAKLERFVRRSRGREAACRDDPRRASPSERRAADRRARRRSPTPPRAAAALGAAGATAPSARALARAGGGRRRASSPRSSGARRRAGDAPRPGATRSRMARAYAAARRGRALGARPSPTSSTAAPSCLAPCARARRGCRCLAKDFVVDPCQLDEARAAGRRRGAPHRRAARPRSELRARCAGARPRARRRWSRSTTRPSSTRARRRARGWSASTTATCARFDDRSRTSTAPAGRASRPDVVVVAESGIATRRRRGAAGARAAFDAVLVGEALMRRPTRPRRRARGAAARPAAVSAWRSGQDLRRHRSGRRAGAAEAGADCLGFNFCAASPRASTLEPGAGDRGAVRGPAPRWSASSADRRARRLDGWPPPARRSASTRPAPRRRGDPSVARASPAGRVQGVRGPAAMPAEPTELAAYGDRLRLLLDTPHAAPRRHRARVRTGTLAARVAARRRLIVLAGWAHADNVADARRAVRPCGVDVASRRGGGARHQGPGAAAALFVEVARMARARARAARRGGSLRPYGGRFVPETLMAPLAELTRAYTRRSARPGLPPPSSTRCCATTPAARRRSTSRSACSAELRRRARSTSSARTCSTPAPTRSTTRSARRCSPGAWASARVIAETGAGQHGVATATAARAFGLACVVYMGERGHAPPGAQRRPHAAARRRGRAGRVRQPHAQGRDQRGDARLGDQRRATPTTARLGARPAPVPDDGARLPRGDRRRGARADRAPARRAGCPTCWSPASAAAATPSACSPRSSATAEVRADRRRGRRPGHRDRASTRRRFPSGDRSACCTARARSCCRTRTGRSAPTHSVSAGLDYPASAPSTPGSHEQGRAEYASAHRRGGDRRLPACWRAPRASCPRWRARTRSPGCCARRRARLRRARHRQPLRARRQGRGGGAARRARRIRRFVSRRAVAAILAALAISCTPRPQSDALPPRWDGPTGPAAAIRLAVERCPQLPGSTQRDRVAALGHVVERRRRARAVRRGRNPSALRRAH